MILEHIFRSVILLNSDNSHKIMISSPEKDLLSIDDLNYDNCDLSKVDLRQKQVLETFKFYKEFEKNLKLKMIKENIQSQNPTNINQEDNSNDMQDRENKFLENALNEIDYFIQDKIKNNLKNKILSENELKSESRIKNKCINKRLSILEVKGLKKLYKYKKALVYNRQEK